MRLALGAYEKRMTLDTSIPRFNVLPRLCVQDNETGELELASGSTTIFRFSMGNLRSGTIMSSKSAGSLLSIDSSHPLPDLTCTLLFHTKRIVGHGSFSTVYRCSRRAQGGDVAVKALEVEKILRHVDQVTKDVLLRKIRRELGIWRRLDSHPNIVQLLGMANGTVFGSDYPCFVSTWMPNGTLLEYITYRWATLPLPRRIDLIKGSVAGLEYLHSENIIHGDLHPGNIMIDGDNNARLTDLGFAQTVTPVQDSSYLWTDSVLPGAAIYAAPELLCPDLYPNPKVEPTLSSDIYSLGSIFFFIISGQNTWSSKDEAKRNLDKFQNPSRPIWPAKIPDDVWDFIVRCWSPQKPSNRPPAQEVLSFANDKLGQLLRQPNPASLINVVLFGPTGCGKSSIINLLSGKSIAPISVDAEPCTKRPQWYDISIDGRKFRLWDTMGFHHADGGETSRLSSYEQAHAVLQNLPDGVNLILLCANKDAMGPSLGNLYYLLNNNFYRGHAPIALVVTHSDSDDEQWWERNQQIITEKTNIPVQYLPIACTTTVQSSRDRSREVLKSLLQNHAIPPISPNLGFSETRKASYKFTQHSGLLTPDVTELLLKFNRPPRPINVVFFGESGAGVSSVINLIVGSPAAEVSSAIKSCTAQSHSYPINTGTQQFLVWDTMGLNAIHIGGKMPRRATDDATRLVRDLFRKGAIDLLVFCKKSGRLTLSERDTFKFFEETLCEGQVPVAVVITHLESMNPMEKWWDKHGKDFTTAIGRDVVGHACITSLSSGNHPNDANLSQKLLESRLTVQTMLEDASRSIIPRRS